MNARSDVVVIIPALNEEASISAVVAECRAHGYDVIVTDDDSQDKTADAAAEAGAGVLKMPYKSGAWAAIQAGLLHAVKTGSYTFFITLDADGQHEPEYIPSLIREYESQKANVVIGSYPERGSMARKAAWRFFSLLTQLKIKDITSGFRLYDSKAVDVLLTHEAALLDYQDLGVLLHLRRYTIEYCEIPVFMNDRISGHSRVFDTWFTVVWYMLKTCMWIVADWVAGSPQERGGWRKYESL